MIVTIHQPEHLPWLGFFNKVDQADALVLLDVVQFRKGYFQNRNRIVASAGPMWLTVPVHMTGYTTSHIKDMRVNNDVAKHNGVDWRRVHWKTIQSAYGTHPHFTDVAPILSWVYERRWDFLAPLNEAIIRSWIEWLGIRTSVVRASQLGVTGTRSALLAEICRNVGADSYLSGPTGREYLDEAPFSQTGVEVRYHEFEHPTYPQAGRQEFVSHLSTLDLLMNCGSRSLEVIRSGTRTPASGT